MVSHLGPCAVLMALLLAQLKSSISDNFKMKMVSQKQSEIVNMDC
jgi:hypothetical protein